MRAFNIKNGKSTCQKKFASKKMGKVVIIVLTQNNNGGFMQTIKFEDFQKIDLRVGKIKNCEDVEGADKLYKITVDIGEERTIVAGIKPYYRKDELIGKRIVVVVNLEPRKVRGIVSEGMLLAAIDKSTNDVVILTVDKNVEAGSKIS